ncbi:ATPase, T2SS/T4P/T4SS family, partial [Gammaproteobacteria bacterium]|nr:ATPase, T2SS/T4P/T4SS family [Gammaproteobacteria bacterium]
MITDDRQAIHQLDAVIARGIALGASDIHIDPGAQWRLRLRVDGTLIDDPTLPAEPIAAQRLVARIKTLAGLDIAERRRPQDGLLTWQTDQQLRVSSVATRHGEKLVLR